MEKVVSKDETEIAYDMQGQGPTVILIDGVLVFNHSDLCLNYQKFYLRVLPQLLMTDGGGATVATTNLTLLKKKFRRLKHS